MRQYTRIIIAVFAVSMLLLGYFTYLLLHRFGEAVRYTDSVNDTYSIINRLEQLESYVKDAETGQRGFIITNDSAYLEPLFNIKQKVFPLADTLAKMAAITKQKERMIMMKATVGMVMSHVENNLQLAEEGNKIAYKKNMDEGKRLMDGLRMEIANIRSVELGLLTSNKIAKKNYLDITSTTFIAAFSLLCLLTFSTFLLLMRELRQRYKFQQELQHHITELQRFTKESEELSYVLAHDMQEPMRKIRIFTDRLFQKHNAYLDNEGREIVQRLNNAAATAQELLKELSRFTEIIKKIDDLAIIDLNKIIAKVLKNLDEIITEKNSKFSIADKLPTITGVDHQLLILFSNLFSNAIIFSKKDVAPIITIQCFKVKGEQIRQATIYQRQDLFYAIKISDNGIGFEQEYAEKMFQLFKKLHIGNEQYPGKGIGLSICQRIMANHNGFISANGKLGEGADFTVYFPTGE